MNNHELQMLVEDISLKFFNEPFNHKATFNPRLRTTGGRYFVKSHNLEFNLKLYDQYGQDELVNIIKHELCHYHLHLQGKGYLHRDKDFKELLERVGGSRFAKPLDKVTSRPYRYVIKCTNCDLEIYRKRRIDLKKYRCGKCNGKLQINFIKK
ncbi:SprT family protein [Vulcanibacillus modesticaldus]|uniref:Protein SprT-like n=1 Tax=Vulcanibacillus modesticaldus TaxID=337097 RepID=A0A1D2YX18_9BACI|nr:SprT family protein [Vulcanibacillus modesticaldus]OEG00254.1 SprT family protein [Vulcanibacillus modesticaldus]